MTDDGDEQPRVSKRRQRDETHNNDAAMTDAADTHQAAADTNPPPPQPPPTLKLRNYRPKDKSIAYQTLPRPSYSRGPHTGTHSLLPLPSSVMSLPSAAAFVADSPPPPSELICACCVVSDTEWLDSELSSVVRSAVMDDSDVLLAIAPQSINSDLKRDIAPQLAILKRQTRQALQQLISRTTHTAATSCRLHSVSSHDH